MPNIDDDPLYDFNYFKERRLALVKHLLREGYLKTERVKRAMLAIPREMFLPENIRRSAYADSPLSTFEGQTISAPHMNAMMCEILDLKPGEKVLEIGTGSGYHAALCAYIVAGFAEKEYDLNIPLEEIIKQSLANKESHLNPSGKVYSIERIKRLYEFALNNIKNLKLDQFIQVIHGDGTLGYKEESPYDKILVTAAAPRIPQAYIDQLKIGGKLVIPVGWRKFNQRLVTVEKTEKGIKKKDVCGVIFVPLIGKEGFNH
ncbi:MAG: protein-L-isoaspartate(D-aspartate) O-methyltransferase [Promethearchaeota archaeon]